LTSHYMEDVEALCDRVVIINHGELMYDGKLQTLVDKYAVTKQLEVTFTEKVEKSVLSPLGKIKEYTAKRVILEVPKKDARWVAAKMLTTLPVDDILINEADVEEVIRRVFSEK